MNYQLDLKQIVDFPRCRIYRDFIQTLITDKSILTSEGSCLFYFLCSAPMPTTGHLIAGWKPSPIRWGLGNGYAPSKNFRPDSDAGSSTRLFPS